MIDDYPTCDKTYATLHIFRDNLDPKELTNLLRLEPTHCQRKGDPYPTKNNPDKKYVIGGWFLSSEGKVDSNDSQKYLRWVLDQIAPQSTAFLRLHQEGYRIEISCYWSSRNGHGGPTLSPGIMAELSRLGIELWFDVYA